MLHVLYMHGEVVDPQLVFSSPLNWKPFYKSYCHQHHLEENDFLTVCTMFTIQDKRQNYKEPLHKWCGYQWCKSLQLFDICKLAKVGLQLHLISLVSLTCSVQVAGWVCDLRIQGLLSCYKMAKEDVALASNQFIPGPITYSTCIVEV